MGALLLVLALVLTLSFLPSARGLPVLLGRWQRVVLGGAAFLIPVLLFLGGTSLAIAGERARFSRRIAAVGTAVLTGLAVYHAQVPRGREFSIALQGEGAGVIGAAIIWALRTVLGEIGAWLVIVLAAVTTLVLWTGVSFGTLMQGIWQVLSATARFVGAVAVQAGRQTMRGARTGLDWARGHLARLIPVPGGPQPMPASGPLPETPGQSPPAGGPGREAGHSESVSPSPPALDVVTKPQARKVEVRPAQHQQESLALDAPSGGYQLPPLSLLTDLPARTKGKAEPAEVALHLEQTLTSFGVEAKVIRWEQGPVVTRFEVQPAPGVRVQKISSLTNDIALALAAPSVRIEAPIPGKSAVGIELPNQKTSLVHIKEILEADDYRRASTPLTVALGKDIAGHPILGDLAEMPHLLIAGATGSGKSVMLNAIIAGLLFRCTPLDVRLLMIDPKRVEFTNYNNIPHLLIPVVTNPRAVAGALKEMLREMEQRFERFAEAGVRNIQGYNSLPDGGRLPFIVIIIDELADLMMIAPADFEDVICRLAQMTRATGIHMVLATQRPSVDVITGLIKANIPSRVAFAVSSQVDSRTILDMPGAEKLLGKGDMLYMPIGVARPVRAQGAFIADSEIQALVTWWKAQGKPVFDQSLLKAEKATAEGEGGGDELLAEAARLIVRSGYGSVSLLQRKMKIGYVRAARIVDQLEEKGIVGATQGSNPREVLMGVDELERLLRAGKTSA
ncbi:MAG TPA: DNA translocase FtsK 4TM domain-containing protein [bacterium]|nr:DNA translocase FtsK 4TM domain-containing protein [bacterium]